jgi:hypothetical protein
MLVVEGDGRSAREAFGAASTGVSGGASTGPSEVARACGVGRPVGVTSAVVVCVCETAVAAFGSPGSDAQSFPRQIADASHPDSAARATTGHVRAWCHLPRVFMGHLDDVWVHTRCHPVVSDAATMQPAAVETRRTRSRPAAGSPED